jgi:hypothetical protein
VRNLLRSIIGILAISFSYSCSDLSDEPRALLNLVLVDAPPAYDSVFIEILGVDVRMNVEGRDTEEQSFFIPYELGDKRVRVSDLVGGEVLLLGRGTLPPGRIIELEMRLGTEHSLWENENLYPIALPTDEEALVNIPVSLDLDGGLSYDVILDFDLEKSIQTTRTEPFAFELTPTVTAILPGTFGEIRGSVSPTTPRPSITAILNGDSISTHTNTAGAFLFRLQPGIYDLYLDPKDEAFLADTIRGVEVRLRETLTLDRINFRSNP